MKQKKILFLFLCFLLSSFSSDLKADTFLYDWAFFINGTSSTPSDDMPTNLDDSLFDWDTGLGTLQWTTTASQNKFIAFFDHEIDESIISHWDEKANIIGTPDTRQSWEIDEPGYGTSTDPVYFGDIYDNVVYGYGLDNQYFNNSYDESLEVLKGPDFEDDVSMAMGWDFTLNSGETAVITLLLSDSIPDAGFYLLHYDPNSIESIYFSSSIEISGISIPVCEPATLMLLGSGLTGLFGFRIRKSKKNSLI